MKAVGGSSVPQCYEHEDTEESIQLWRQLKKSIKKAVEEERDVNVDVNLTDWKVGSIKISFHIIKVCCLSLKYPSISLRFVDSS